MDNAKDARGESWYTILLQNITSLSDQLELRNEKQEAFRAGVMEIAKAQYCAGNKAGIRWLRLQLNKDGQGGAAA